MSFANFKPNVWAAGINRELERKCVFVEDCYSKFTGDVKKQGESITFVGIGKPTITLISKADGVRSLGPAEKIADQSIVMYVNQLATYNYAIDDIDEAQANQDIDGALDSETSEALANVIDKYIAGKAVDDNARQLYASAVKVTHKEDVAGEKYILDAIDEAYQILKENDVAQSTYVSLTVSPKFARIFNKAYRHEDTNNSDELKHGKICMYSNITVKESNNVYRDSSGVDYIMLRTKRAIGFAKPFTFAEPMRDTDWFTDIIRGYVLFDAMIIRPKEMVVLNVKYA